MASTSIPDPSDHPDVGRPPDDLTGAVLSGARWKALTRVVSTATRAIVVIVLARFLTPAEYGVAGMAFVVTSFGLMLTDPALGAALVQRATIDERDRSTVFWIVVSIGAVLSVVGVAVSGLVADFFGEPQVGSLFVATSLCFVVVSLSVTHQALLTRRLAYRSLEIREIAAVLAGGLAAIAAAIAGLGPWAVVINFVVSSLVTTVSVWLLLDWRPRATFSFERAKSLGSFSGRIFSAGLLAWGDQNVDKTLIGRFLGPTALGAYSISYAAMLLPMTMLGRPFNQVLSPAFSRIQDEPARLERAWLRSKRLTVAVIAPGMLALAVLAPDFIPVIFGNQWDAAILPLQLLCIGGFASSLTNLNWSVLQARGEAATLLRMALFSSLVKWSAVAVGLQWGIVGVAAGYAVARCVLVAPTTWMTTRGVSFGFSSALAAGAGVFPATILAAGVGFAARQLLLEASTPQALRLVVTAAVMLVAYAALTAATVPSIFEELRRAVRRGDGASATRAGPA